MRAFKKFLQITILSMIFLLLVVPVSAASTTTGNATYEENQKLDKMDIGYGVSYLRSIGKSSATIRSGTKYNQTVYYLNTVCNDTIRVIPWARFVNNRWRLTNVQTLMADFEEKNPGWIALAGVNADFFDTNSQSPYPYQAQNALVIDGNVYRTSGKDYNRDIGITNDGAIDSLKVKAVPPVRQYLTLEVLDDNGQKIVAFDVEKINAAPGANQTAVFFGTYNVSQGYDAQTIPGMPSASVFYVEEADLVLPNSATDFYGKGTISSASAFSIAVGQFAVASNNQNVIDALAIGKKIRVQRYFTGEFADLKYVVGGGTAVLEDGEAPANVNTVASVMGTNHPRTAIGRKADGSIVLSVVDGRMDDNVSRGVYGDELGAIMKHAGCVEAYNLDGGGSSTLVVRENNQFVIKNIPSDYDPGKSRAVSSGLLIVTRAPEYEVELTDATDKTLDISVNPIITNNHDFTNLYAYITGGIEEKLVNGKVSFTGLKANSTYNCRFYYKIGDINVDLPGTYQFKTTVTPHTFTRVEVNIVGDLYNFEVKFRDRDNETNLSVATLHINGRDYQLIDGKISLSKTAVNELAEFSIEYNCTNSMGVKRIVIKNPDSTTLRFMEELFQKKDKLASSLFK